MHELSIALSIVEMAEEEAEKLGARITGIHVKLGVLSGVVKEALLGSYEIASSGTSLEGSQLIVTDIPLVVFCPQCRLPVNVSTQRLVCPECGTPAPEVIQGRELQVTALEVAS